MANSNKSKTVKITSVFPAPKAEIFKRLQGFAILKEIAYPYITFKPLDGDENLKWQVGKTFSFKAKLLGVIPFGIHHITLIEFDEEGRIYSNEYNKHVPTWNHLIVLKELTENQTEYTDEVEIYAGWKTPFVYLWANLFYRHRQRKWIRILKEL